MKTRATAAPFILVLLVCKSLSLAMKIAIIGGGVSGLSCARALSRQAPSIEYTLFDTGKRSVGGRCSSREIMIDGEKIVIDHAAQYLQLHSQSHPTFRDFVMSKVRNGALVEFNSQCIGQISGNPQLQKAQDSNDEDHSSMNYVCPSGMGHFTKEVMMEGIEEVKQDVWINKLVKKEGSTKWSVFGKGKCYGEFDKIIIAHNGKCADRLVSGVSTRVPAIHERLKVNFGPSVKNMRKMHLCSLFVLAFVVPVGSIPSDYGYYSDDRFAFDVKPSADNTNSDDDYASKLAWICNTSRKIKKVNGKYESWTLVSTREYAAKNKVPQEAIPHEDEVRIRNDLISAFERCLCLPSIADDIQFSKLQLWGAAIPLNRLNCPFIYDGKEGIGVCGDWFDTGAGIGPSIETAFMSGNMLAQHIVNCDATDAYIEDNKYHYEAIVDQNSLGDVDSRETFTGVSRQVKRGPLLNPLEYVASMKTNGPRKQSSTPNHERHNGNGSRGNNRRRGFHGRTTHR